MGQQQDDTCSASLVSSIRDSWARVYEYATKSSALLGGRLPGSDQTAVGSPSEPTRADTDSDRREPPIAELAYTEDEWSFDRSTDVSEELSVGDRVTFIKRLTDTDVRKFAEISGDTNRLHLDSEFAEQTRFDDRIVHGTLLSGLVSAALARLPGVTVYLSQNMEFRAPARIGDRLTVVCEIAEDLSDDRYRLTTRVYDSTDELLADGEAVVLMEDFPAEQDEEAAENTE